MLPWQGSPSPLPISVDIISQHYKNIILIFQTRAVCDLQVWWNGFNYATGYIARVGGACLQSLREQTLEGGCGKVFFNRFSFTKGQSKGYINDPRSVPGLKERKIGYASFFTIEPFVCSVFYGTCGLHDPCGLLCLCAGAVSVI